MHAGPAFERQGVHGQVVGGELFDLLQGPAHLLFALAGKSQDDIHVDIVKAGLPAHVEGLADLVHRVPAADQAQGLLVHGLRVDADPGDVVRADDTELFLCDAVRPSRLDGKFLQPVHGKEFFQHGEKPLQLARLQGRRRAAADVDRIQDQALHQSGRRCHLLLKRVQIGIDAVLPQSQVVGGERAVETGRGAEGDPDIEAVTALVVNAGQDLPLPLCDLRGQKGLLRAHQVVPLHGRGRLLDAPTLQKRVHGDLGRPYADQLAPGEGAFFPVCQRIV